VLFADGVVSTDVAWEKDDMSAKTYDEIVKRSSTVASELNRLWSWRASLRSEWEWKAENEPYFLFCWGWHQALKTGDRNVTGTFPVLGAYRSEPEYWFGHAMVYLRMWERFYYAQREKEFITDIAEAYGLWEHNISKAENMLGIRVSPCK